MHALTGLCLAILLTTAAGGSEPETGKWVVISEGVTSKLEPKWPGLTAGIAVDPIGCDVYMPISGLGVWKSRDYGTTFEQIDGGHVGGRCETGAAISVDPMGGGRLAFFQLDGKSAWTPDGGKTWLACNDQSRGFDFVAVDWTDPRARRMFGVRHESGEIGLLSEDSGATWKTLGKGFLCFGVFDFDTLVTTRGEGIERSTDGGATWAKVSDQRPTGRVMAYYRGAGYWLTERGLIASKDKGATWTSIPSDESPSSAWFGPHFGRDENHMVVIGKAGFLETTNAGRTWEVAAPLPDVQDFNGPWYANYAWDWRNGIFYASKMGKPAYRYRQERKNRAVIDVWPGTPPDESGGIGPVRLRMSPELDRTQTEVTESTRMITDVERPTLTVHRPEGDRTAAAVLICPGGGYWNLYVEVEGEEVAAWLNTIGVAGAVLEYRVPRRPGEPEAEPARRPLQDAQRAISLLRSRAGEWNIDPARIGILGFSAGGHLAIAAATSFEKRSYSRIDAVDDASCRPDFAAAVYPGYLKAKDKSELAPGLAIPAGTPPVFLAHGGADIVSSPEHSVVLYLALQKAGIPAELHIYAGAAHGFGVRATDRPFSAWTGACARWLAGR